VTLLRGDKSKEKKVFICGEAETLLAALTKGLA
jgi:hypothetical protein